MSVILFDRSFASHEKSQYWSDKNAINPNQITKGSEKKYWFVCNKCSHDFYKSVVSVCKGEWCPYCANCILCNNQDCKICFEKSFASQEKVLYWSKINTKSPREVFKSEGKKYWFDCDKCVHTFEKPLNAIIRGGWCPYCCNQKMCFDINCNYCFELSFASHSKVKYWSAKNTDNPRELFKNTEKQKYWFDCDKCNHDFETSLTNIIQGCWCPYCAHQKMCFDETCKDCFDKSFASHPTANCWSSKNEKHARDIFLNSNKKYWFNCDTCNYHFQTQANNVNNGKFCPLCVNKTEQKLYKELKSKYSQLSHQFRVDWCKNEKTKKYLPFDFVIPELKIIIELDGLQHIKNAGGFWNTLEENRERDLYKEKCANDNSYSTIRILQEDVKNNKYDWLKELCETIEEIKNGDEVANVYLCKNGEYDAF